MKTSQISICQVQALDYAISCVRKSQESTGGLTDSWQEIKSSLRVHDFQRKASGIGGRGQKRETCKQ